MESKNGEYLVIMTFSSYNDFFLVIMNYWPYGLP